MGEGECACGISTWDLLVSLKAAESALDVSTTEGITNSLKEKFMEAAKESISDAQRGVHTVGTNCGKFPPKTLKKIDQALTDSLGVLSQTLVDDGDLTKALSDINNATDSARIGLGQCFLGD